MGLTTVNLSFQKDLLDQIDSVAQQESRSRSELLREAVRQYIERKSRWDSVFALGDEAVKKSGLTPADIKTEITASRVARRKKT